MGRMQRQFFKFHSAHLSAFVVAGVLGLSATYWVLRWPSAAPRSQPVGTASTAFDAAAGAAVDANTLAQALGASPAPATVAQGLSQRMVLIGVVAHGGGAGAALIAIDGKPAKAFAVGSAIEPGLFLYRVGARTAVLAASAQGPAQETLEMFADKTADKITDKVSEKAL